jgi:hypothetical protein
MAEKSFTKDPLYDYESAPVTPGPNLGHWPSRVGSGPKEGLILKHQDHPTFHLTVKGEQEMGNKMSVGPDGRVYSHPQVPPGHRELTYVGKPVRKEKP